FEGTKRFEAKDLAFSHNGEELAVAGDGEVRIWSTRTWSEIGSAMPGGTAVAWSADDTQVVSIAKSTRAVIVDVASGSVREELPGDSTIDVAWSPKDDLVATTHLDGSVQLWDARNDISRTVNTDVTEPATALAWSPDGDVLVVGDSSGSLRTLDGTSG